MGKYVRLDKDIVDEIKRFQSEMWEKDDINVLFPNVVLKSDVLQLLDRYCRVIYYPLENESNNGFHISTIVDSVGNKQHFVYINTAQSIEKQVFTAAHELGHAWKVEEYVLNKFDKGRVESLNEVGLEHGADDIKERVVNCFAAEVLMPEEVFRNRYENAISKVENNKSIPLYSFLKIVALLMNFFLVPMKSVIIRMGELSILSEDTVNMLISDDGERLTQFVRKYISHIVKEEGYTDLNYISNKMYIEGLSEMLDEAENKQSVSKEKIESIRKKFGLESELDEQELNEQIKLE